jgi:hypothetical protein
MKRLFIASLALILATGAFAQTEGWGIGAILGSSFDFSAKYWTGESTAFALAAGFEFGSYGGVHFTGDYLFHPWSWGVGQDQMKVYLGPGFGMGIHPNQSSGFSMNLRGASGLGYYFHNIPLECIVDLVPSVDLFGPWDFHFRWVSYIGARWYF